MLFVVSERNSNLKEQQAVGRRSAAGQVLKRIGASKLSKTTDPGASEGSKRHSKPIFVGSPTGCWSCVAHVFDTVRNSTSYPSTHTSVAPADMLDIAQWIAQGPGDQPCAARPGMPVVGIRLATTTV